MEKKKRTAKSEQRSPAKLAKAQRKARREKAKAKSGYEAGAS